MIYLKNKKDGTLPKVRLAIAVVSFIYGVLIAGAGVFLIPPIGKYIGFSLSIVREVLILCGAILGICNKSKSR